MYSKHIYVCVFVSVHGMYWSDLCCQAIADYTPGVTDGYQALLSCQTGIRHSRVTRRVSGAPELPDGYQALLSCQTGIGTPELPDWYQALRSYQVGIRHS
jgi:hypothetical protein